jgi:hypothetical protein
MEGRDRIEQPTQPLLHRARSCERNEVTGNDHPGVPERTAAPGGGFPIDERYFEPPSKRIQRYAQTDDAGTDDDDALARHRR